MSWDVHGVHKEPHNFKDSTDIHIDDTPITMQRGKEKLPI